MSEADNLRRYPADQRGVYEVWYVTWNDPKSGDGYWLRYILDAPLPGHGVPPYGDAPRGELWFARFSRRDPGRTFGIHKRFRTELVATSDNPFCVKIAGCELTNDHSFGDLSGGGHDIRWDLRWEPARETLPFFGELFYARPKLASHMAHAPNPAVPLSGTLLVDGDEVSFDRVVATQTHVWGTRHALSWVWAHCHELAGSPGTVIEVLAGKLQRGPFTLPPLAGVVLRMDGETHRLHDARHFLRNRASFRPGEVTFKAMSRTLRIEGSFVSAKEHMVNAPYVDPDGQELWCANTEIADAKVAIYRRSGLRWLLHRELVSDGRAHYEVGGRVRDPGVTTPHVLVS